MPRVRIKGRLVRPGSMSMDDISDYLMTMKPTHDGYGAVAKELVKRRKVGFNTKKGFVEFLK